MIKMENIMTKETLTNINLAVSLTQIDTFESMVVNDMISEGLDPTNQKDIELFWESRLS